jgi:hypothetical protein
MVHTLQLTRDIAGIDAAFDASYARWRLLATVGTQLGVARHCPVGYVISTTRNVRGYIDSAFDKLRGVVVLQMGGDEPSSSLSSSSAEGEAYDVISRISAIDRYITAVWRLGVMKQPDRPIDLMLT